MNFCPMIENELSRSAEPGQVVVMDIDFWPIRVQETLFSWTAPAARKNADGSFTRIN